MYFPLVFQSNNKIVYIFCQSFFLRDIKTAPYGLFLNLKDEKTQHNFLLHGFANRDRHFYIINNLLYVYNCNW